MSVSTCTVDLDRQEGFKLSCLRTQGGVAVTSRHALGWPVAKGGKGYSVVGGAIEQKSMKSSVLLVPVLWPVVLLYAVQGCQELHISCHERLTSFGDLLNRNFPDNSIVCVDLEAGSKETLNYTETILTFSVVVRGNNSTVICNVSEELDNTSYTHFPLRFQNASMVVITELNFQGCARPLQFELVQTVHISSSTFR